MVTLAYASRGGIVLNVTDMTRHEMMVAMDVVYKLRKQESKHSL